ncbi:MAG: 8-oxoguanine DNA glycosylase, N-terminal domain-containing protein, partial [Clostridia bacterium]|nr:8-oxoguanine DNA glycosylase, N-terminal domain-containing protein [Clostridia bacterium]
MLTLKVKNNDLYIYGTKNFDLSQTLDCGQAFRWESEDGKLWKGVAFEKYLELYRDSDAVVFKNTSLSDYQNFWKNYFDLDRNYSEIIEKVKQNEVIAKSIEYAGGIRILNQNPWE